MVEEINSAQKEQARENLSPNCFTIYWLLKEVNIENSKNIAIEINEILEDYPFWKYSSEQNREVKRKISAILIKNGIREIEKVDEIVQKLLRILKGEKYY